MVPAEASLAAATSCRFRFPEAGLRQVRGVRVRRVPSLVVNRVYDQTLSHCLILFGNQPANPENYEVTEETPSKLPVC